MGVLAAIERARSLQKPKATVGQWQSCGVNWALNKAVSPKPRAKLDTPHSDGSSFVRIVSRRIIIGESATDLIRGDYRVLDDLTQQLNAARMGDALAAERALAVVYTELKSLARGIAGRGAQTLTPTVLVHDVFMRLMPKSLYAVDGAADKCAPNPINDRAHFFRLAARAMRQITVEHARAKQAQKRGGEWLQVELDETCAMVESPVDVLALDQALSRLELRDAELTEIVEAHFYAGLSFQEIADITGTSERSVRRTWETARLFLYQALQLP